MGKVRYDRASCERIAAMLRGGHSIDSARRDLMAQGLPAPSVGWISGWRARGMPMPVDRYAAASPPPPVPPDVIERPPTPGRPGPPPTRPPPQEPPPPPVERLEPQPPADDAAIVDTLRQAVADLGRLASQAREVRDVAAASKWQTSMIAMSAELRRLTTSDADPDDVIRGEDIRTAARRARQRLAQAVARAREHRATWPACPTCGHPVRPEGYVDESPMWSVVESMADE